jgi:hypothetical protein
MWTLSLSYNEQRLRGFAPTGILEEWNIELFSDQLAMINSQWSLRIES